MSDEEWSEFKWTVLVIDDDPDILRVAERTLLTEGLADPRLAGLITVTQVRMTEDLHTAIVHVSILPKEKQDLAMHGLRAAARHVRRRAADFVSIRRMPTLVFKLDTSTKREAEILATLAEIAAERSDEAAGDENQPDQPAPRNSENLQ